MAPVHEFGKRQYQPPAERRAVAQASDAGGGMSIVRLALIGFVAAAAAVGAFSFVSMPDFKSLMPSLGEKGPIFSGDRMGRASTAPALKICVRSLQFETDMSEWDPAMIWQLLEAGNMQSVGNRVFGGPDLSKRKKESELLFAQHWGVMADCMLAQDTARLCDIDNRALAVRSTTVFLREAERIIGEAGGAPSYETQSMKSTRDRVVDALRNKLRNGALIAADFGAVVPAPIRDALNDVKPQENACAKKS